MRQRWLLRSREKAESEAQGFWAAAPYYTLVLFAGNKRTEAPLETAKAKPDSVYRSSSAMQPGIRGSLKVGCRTSAGNLGGSVCLPTLLPTCLPLLRKRGSRLPSPQGDVSPAHGPLPSLQEVSWLRGAAGPPEPRSGFQGGVVIGRGWVRSPRGLAQPQPVVASLSVNLVLGP